MIENIAINVIPASKTVSTWLANNNWRDAFVVIPQNLHNFNLEKIVSSYGDQNPTLNQTWVLEMYDTNNTLQGSVQFDHAAATKIVTHVFGQGDLILAAEHTLHVKYKVDPYTDSGRGFSITASFSI